MNFSYSTAVALKIRSRPPKSDQFFIHENLVKIQPLVHKILCRQESVTPVLTPMPRPTGSEPKLICPLPLCGWGGGGDGGGMIFLFHHEIVCCLYLLLLESPHQGDSNEYTQHTIIS